MQLERLPIRAIVEITEPIGKTSTCVLFLPTLISFVLERSSLPLVDMVHLSRLHSRGIRSFKTGTCFVSRNQLLQKHST